MTGKSLSGLDWEKKNFNLQPSATRHGPLHPRGTVHVTIQPMQVDCDSGNSLQGRNFEQDCGILAKRAIEG
jgi:hypothetical protein